MMRQSTGLFVAVAMGHAVASADQVAVKLKVLDEAGKPVPNAEMSVIFAGMNWQLDNEVRVKTNADGLLVTKGWSKDDFLDGVAVYSESPHYYTSRLNVPIYLGADEPGKRDFDLALPVRKKGKPIAMYAKKVELELPEQRKEIGFDFEKADWVKPYGKGEVADCMFLGAKIFKDDDHSEAFAAMTFPGNEAGMQHDRAEKDGSIQCSDFKTSRMAPTDGYQQCMNFIYRWDGENGNKGSTEDANYIFRSRVVLDESGQIKSCHYGKLLDAVDVASRSGYPDGNPIVSFTYYFNPTPNDRNLEFDPEKNLFKDLEGAEQVWDP